MADIKCPSCGKTNPEELEICRFCGALLKQPRTEPLAPISPGQWPERKDTSELERTLPGWLRDARRAGKEPHTSPIPQAQIPQNVPPPSSPPAQKKPDLPFDLLAGLSQAGDDDEEVPDWLKNLQGETSGPVAAESQTEIPETPDGLAELQEEPAETEKLPQPEAWGFTGEALSFNFDETEAPVQSFGDAPDWLAALAAQEAAPQQPQTSADKTHALPDADSGETPDWLSSLGGFETPTPVATGSGAPVEDSPAVAIPPGDLPAWLADLQSPAPTPIEAKPEAPMAETPAGDLPDWLSGLSETSSVKAAEPSSAELPAAETPAGDLPDWLSGLSETSSVKAAEPSSAELPAAEIPAGDLPDWLSGLSETSSVKAAEPSSAELPAAETPAGDLPDWMSGLQETTPSEAAETPPVSETSDLPDWLSSSALEEQPSQSATPKMETPVPPPAEKTHQRVPKPFPTGALDEIRTLAEREPLPDFLSGLVPAEEAKKAGAEPVTEAEPGELPDWLAGMAAGAAAASIETEGKPLTEPDESVEAQAEAGAFSELGAESPVSAEAENIDSLLMDVPDWLSGFTPAADVEQPRAETSPEAADLQPVELPSWVQAMRPVESMLTGAESMDADDGEVEQQGPLAGLRNVLPMTAAGLEIKKPQAYAIKLQVNETQREQAALLERVLASENVPKAVSSSRQTVLLRPLRWILFALLTLVVLIPIILGTRLFPTPALPADASAPFNQFYDTLENTLPDDAPVLVVTDYQPGFAGEIEQAAVPVVIHLMRKSAQVAFLSTSPINVEMGERLLQKARAFYAENGQEAPLYLFGDQYLFLGYLPGGAAGVNAFAAQPQKTTGVDSLNGDLWQTDMLRNKINDISGFAAVIVLTDDPDHGRLWIEQTGTRLGNTPLLMVTSAQAGPMIQPYADSGQLRGLVIGLEGGALYEKRDAQPGNPYPGHIKALYWDGFGAALSVALLSIFFGAVWSLVERFRARKEVTEQDEA